MGRGLLLGIVWGVTVAIIAGATLSLMNSPDQDVPMENEAKGVVSAPQAVEPEVDVVESTESDPVVAETEEPESEPVAPAIGAVEAPTQGVDAEETNAEETNIPITDTIIVPTDTPAAPAIAQSDAPPANADAATVDAPQVMIPDEGNADGVQVRNEDASGTMTTNDTPVASGTASELPKPPNSETQPETHAGTEAMTAPEMQEGPVAGEGPIAKVDEDTNAPDVHVEVTPSTVAPDQPLSPQQDANVTEVAPAPELTRDPPVEVEPITPAPKSDGSFDTARVPVPKIINLDPNVRTKRLPTIGGESEADDAAVGETTSDPDLKGLTAHAMAFENPDAKPMFSVVLIDDPENPLSDDVLSHLPFAVSFAIDAVREDAHAAAARYRAAGFEVLMLTNLPFGASATDIEVVFGAYSRAIPHAIGVLDLGANGFLRGPSTATQIAGIMSEHGYGLITPSKGLNSAQKAAKREGVPSVLLYRELDVDGEKPAVIRRYLDRAAFRAAQEGSVIMLGRTRPDTIEALVTWALEDRAASVAMAPVSAVMLAQ